MPPPRLSLFYRVLGSVQPLVRRRRMQKLALLELKPGDKVIDLGGTTQIWNLIETPLEITVVNLPGVEVQADPATRHKFHFIAGDATNLAQFPDNHFDLVFSNSVIEHVGGEENERAFAREARRLAPRYYVQTPSIWFPLEPHSGVPFWWLMPNRMRQNMIDRWRKKLPDWTAMIEGTTVITRRKLQSYFPDGTVVTERLAGIPKSYVVYRKA